jgi:thiamine-phosphate pyrophosphorylase
VRDERATTRFYAVLEAGWGAEARLKEALAAADVACVLIAAAREAELEAASAAALVAAAQNAGAAALVADDAELARALKADGVHLSAKTGDIVAAYRSARASLGESYIVGAETGGSRHEAMTVAELGADYVGFGILTGRGERAHGRAHRDDLIAWWSEIFEVPCVAFGVESPEEAALVAGLGADFIGVAVAGGISAEATRRLFAEMSEAISARERAS